MNWYLLNTKPNAHNIASTHLKRQGFKIFLPLMIKTSKRAGKFVDETIPLFPGYLFIGTELDQIPWKSLNATRGISKVVTLDGNYRPIDPNIVESIKFRCNQSNILQTVDRISLGDRVRIERGPFSDFVCNVDKIAGQERVWVLINILQQKTRTKVALADLSRVD